MAKSTKTGAESYDAWLKSQSAFFEQWTEAAENFQKTLKGMDWTQGTQKDTRDLFSVYNSWNEMFSKYFDVMIKNYSPGISKDTASKLFSGADAYVKLYEFWEPLMKAFQERALEPGSYKDLLDPSKYKEMIDKVFGFSSPETLTEFYGQASKLIETWGSKGELFVKPWSDAMQKNIDANLELASGDPEASMNIFHNLYSAYESTFGKAFKMPAVGKDREEIELFLKTIDKYSVFLAKNTEFQHTIYLKGQNAMEKVIAATAKKIKENEEIISFDECFQLWHSTNEKTFLELFTTEEFSKLQGVVLDAALDARRHSHHLMELYLSDFPIALRSEMDDVYKTIYGLNKQVRELKKKSSAMEEMHKEIKDLRKKVAGLEKKKSVAAKVKKKAGKGVTR
jgi:polyhydroxyalkanoate synthesis regulator phasin